MSMTVNRLKGETILKFNDVEYKANMSLDTIIRLEEKVGLGIFELATRFSKGEFKVNQIISILTTAIRGGGNDVKDSDIKRLVNDIGIVQAVKITADLITFALNVEEEGEKKSEEQI